MDPDLMDLASVAAGEMVKLLVTDVWERVKAAVGGLWRRVHPDRADAIESDLAAAREELLDAWQTGNEQVRQLLIAEWQSRLSRLLTANPELAAELRRMVAGGFGLVGESAPGTSISMKARVSGGGNVYQAGRDQAIGLGMSQADRQPPPGAAQ